MLTAAGLAVAALTYLVPLDPEDRKKEAAPASSHPIALPPISLQVVSPEEGRVGLRPPVRVSGAVPAGYTLVVMVQARGSEWYVSPCTADSTGDTSMCGGVQFGASEREPGAWDLVALLLNAQQAQDVLSDNQFRGDVKRLDVAGRSRTYKYVRVR